MINEFYLRIFFVGGFLIGVLSLFLLINALDYIKKMDNKNKEIINIRHKYMKKLNDKDYRKYNENILKIEGLIKND